MKVKVLQFVIIAFIVFMIGGILSAVSTTANEDTTVITSEFDDLSEYTTEGYTSTDPFEEDNVNNISKINQSVGETISIGINKVINLFFEFIKKFVS